MSTIRKYIIVDDDEFNNILCSMTIERALVDVDVKSFTLPEEGLAFIKHEYIHGQGPTILFLDINMPALTGWEFIEEYEKFSEEVKKEISIYIVSSSIDYQDKVRANASKYIKGFISKPVSLETIHSVAEI